jgi:hypothetical protein
MSKHTPGPWNLGSSDLPVSGLSIHANVAGRKHSTLCRLVSAKYSGMSQSEEYATAKLIAAAPQLLEALQNLLAWAADVHAPGATRINYSGMDAARAAIAKATGEWE